MPNQCRCRLTELPYDVVILIAQHLLPYDVLAMSSTCTFLRQTFTDKSIWLQVCDVISRARPLPFTPCSTSTLSVTELHHASLRAQRVAQRWAEDVVSPQEAPTIFSFDDKRQVQYFAFLPGAHNLLVFDVRNTLSCWSSEGTCLTQYNAGQGVQLTRWRPSDGSTENMDEAGGQLVEIMVDYPHSDSDPCRSEIIWLYFTRTSARFTPTKQFLVPSIYMPVSALTQDEIHGMLTLINPEPASPDHRIGIYLTDINAGKAICIDTGLSPEFSPQSLLSTHYMVLYWETSRGAETHTYALSMLRELLVTSGLEQDDARLRVPIHIPPTISRVIPFRTTKPDYSHPRTKDDGDSSSEDVEFDMSRNMEWYPIIIPKWQTLREDANRHRVRSVMTLSRRLGPEQEHDLRVIFQALNDVLDMQPPGVDGDDEEDPNAREFFQDMNHFVHAAHRGEGVQIVPFPPNVVRRRGNDDGNDGNADMDRVMNHIQAFENPHPMAIPWEIRTTITHHYFDYAAQVPEVKRTVLADVHLRRLPSRVGEDFDGFEAIDDHFEDPYAGSPVIGYGGKCALWIEEVKEESVGSERRGEDRQEGGSVNRTEDGSPDGDEDSEDDHRENMIPVMRLATFPSFKGDYEDGSDRHEELIRGEGNVCTFKTPRGLNLDEAVCLDLDDARGIVGVATGHGEVWLIDYS